MSKVLKDIRGVDIDCGDTIAVTYYDYDKEKSCSKGVIHKCFIMNLSIILRP